MQKMMDYMNVNPQARASQQGNTAEQQLQPSQQPPPYPPHMPPGYTA